jgi:hypothetical protein
MKYEILKKLQDAGFPIPDKCGHCKGAQEGEIHNPTLRELIKACEPNFNCLARGVDGIWYAVAFSLKEPAAQVSVHAESANEAMANLYLALRGDYEDPIPGERQLHEHHPF